MSEALSTIAAENHAAARAFAPDERFVASMPDPQDAVAPASVSLLSMVPGSIVLLLAGLVAVAMAIVVPSREQSRQARHELAAIEAQVSHVQRQIDVNARFLEQIRVDPTLAMRLRLRQQPPIAGTPGVLDVGGSDMSPFSVTRLPPPDAFPAYESDLPVPMLLVLHEDARLYSMVIGLMLVAVGLVFGFATPSRSESEQPRSAGA
jgi:uncharacterized membrane protein